MIRLAAALLAIASCQPARADLPPAGAAYPYYLGFVACTEDACDTRYRPIYVESATACTTTAVTLLPQLVRAGETIEEWWCE